MSETGQRTSPIPHPPMPGYHHYTPRTYLGITELATFARCPRRFFFSVGCSMTAQEAVALKFGEAIHAALPYAFFQQLDVAFQAFDAVWQDRGGDEKRNRENARLILLSYAASHTKGRSIYELIPPPNGLVRTTDAISEYEIAFAIDIGLPVPIMSRVDGLCRHRDTGELWALEFKTSSELSTRFFQGFIINPQVYAYTLACRLYGLDVKGTIVEGIGVSKTKHESICQAIPVTPFQIDDFVEWARFVGHQIIACEEHKHFPKDISGCAPYSQFGQPGYQCDFTTLCTTKDWTELKSMYTVKEPRQLPFAVPELIGENNVPANDTVSAAAASRVIPLPLILSSPQRPEPAADPGLSPPPQRPANTGAPVFRPFPLRQPGLTPSPGVENRRTGFLINFGTKCPVRTEPAEDRRGGTSDGGEAGAGATAPDISGV